MKYSIETIYKTIKYRSRLEARWAVFFDLLGIEFYYEPEGYVLDGIPYLPDFYLPKQDCFVEIKGINSDPNDDLKPALLCEKLQKRVNYIVGDFPSKDQVESLSWNGFTNFSPYEINGKIVAGMDMPYYWCECSKCGYIDAEFDGRSERLKCSCNNNEHKIYNHFSPDLLSAYYKAKNIKFQSKI